MPGGGSVSPKTAARTAGTRPAAMAPEATTPSYRVEARLAQGESFLPRSGMAAEGWWPPPGTETLFELGKRKPRSGTPKPAPTAHPEPKPESTAHPELKPESTVHPEPGAGPKGKLPLAILSAVDPMVLDWAVQHHRKGFIEFGTDASGQRLAMSPQGFGYVTANVESLPEDMRMLSPEEASKSLKEGDYFVNRSGPITSRLSPFMQSVGDYEWFELWQMVNGLPRNTGCRTDRGSSGRFMRSWDEAELRRIWNRMSFRCPSRIVHEPEVV
jgi:hypothetical protein